MEVQNIIGKNNSKIYYIPSINQIFLLKEKKKNGIMYLKCFFKACKSSGKIIDNKFHEMKNEHNHLQNEVDEELSYCDFLKDIKENNKIQNAKSAFDNAFVKYGDKILDKCITYPSLRSTINRHRSKNISRSPKSVEDLKNLLINEDVIHNHCMYNNEIFINWIKPSSEKSGFNFVCFSPSYVDKIGRENVKAFADATYKISHSMFEQFFTIHFQVSDYAFACLFVFMERRTVDSYKDVFNYLKENGFSFNTIMLDFEQAIKSAIRLVFPSCKILGCQFHYSQCLLRQMQKLKLDIDYGLIRKMSSLALLPLDLIRLTYNQLKEKYKNRNNKLFFDYYEHQWIKKIKPENFCVFEEDDMTNNKCEAFHSYLKNKASNDINLTPNTNFFKVLFVETFYDYKYENQVKVSSLLYNESDIELEEDEESDQTYVEIESIGSCFVCKEVSKIVGMFPSCHHFILCHNCTNELLNRNQTQCVYCRSENNTIITPLN
ncbi:hypothetical protein PVAND_013704 [Polypedilum vanderplanki]|uniref:RING-type domain-containing protein n=1 Tax=Polypedilum vanderplanki TaxID=319348 RepID=A0A9J6CS61_POLVA|nr:hypothetical protein PVAND_013704 [Polypedilum vanderplanki]